MWEAVCHKVRAGPAFPTVLPAPGGQRPATAGQAAAPKLRRTVRGLHLWGGPTTKAQTLGVVKRGIVAFCVGPTPPLVDWRLVLSSLGQCYLH